MKKPLRVLHCPTMVGGNPQNLARAERAIGLDSRAIAFKSSIYRYPSDEILFDDADSMLSREWKRLELFWRAIAHFDVIHFNFGQSIMRQAILPSEIEKKNRPWLKSPIGKLAIACNNAFHLRDLPLLKWAGKQIAVTYQGDDARQGDYCLAHFDITHAKTVEADYYTPETDAQKRRNIATFDRYADHIFALNPDLLHVLPTRARFVPYANVDIREWEPAYPLNERPIILHAPSARLVKGTQYLLDAVSQLQSEGLDFEFILVEGLSNQEAKELYKRADILVDQLLCGWYGGLAVELMALGKPVVCYLREGDLHFLPPEMRQDLPIVQATPESIADVLRDLLTSDRAKLVERGHRSRAYVERWHDPLLIAETMREAYSS